MRGTAHKKFICPQQTSPAPIKYRTDEAASARATAQQIVDAKQVDVNSVDTNRVELKNVKAKCVDISAVDIKRSLGDALGMDEHEITAAQLELRQLLADNVRRFRNARNVSQEGLAALAGLHRTYVSQIERKVTNTSLDNIAKLALALKIHAGELLQKPEIQVGTPSNLGESGSQSSTKSRHT